MQNKRICSMDIFNTYIVMSFINMVAVVVALFVTEGQFLSEIVWDARHDLFIDYMAKEGDISGSGGYYFFRFLDRLSPNMEIENSSVNRWGELSCVILISLCVGIIVLLIHENLNESLGKTAMFSGIFLLSQPFAFACIKSGNTLFFSLTALLIAMYLREREEPLCKEIALLCIAFAADLKFAPAVFGIFYLKEKRFKEAFRLAVYGAVFVVAQQFLSQGVEMRLASLSEHSGLLNPRPETIIGVVLEFADVVGIPSSQGFIMGKICAYVYFLTCVVLFFYAENNWKTTCLITSLLIIFVNMSYPYTLCYLLIPLLQFLREEKGSDSLISSVYAICFALIFNVYPLLRIDWPTATFITNYFVLYIFLILLIVDVVRDTVNKRRHVFESL